MMYMKCVFMSGFVIYTTQSNHLFSRYYNIITERTGGLVVGVSVKSLVVLET